MQQLLPERDLMLQELKLEMDPKRMKNQANKRRAHKEFNEGDLVLVKLESYKQTSLQLRKNHALKLHTNSKYFGPLPHNATNWPGCITPITGFNKNPLGLPYFPIKSF